jgi:hypothetical protein
MRQRLFANLKRRSEMEYDEKMFEKIAIPRIKKFYEINKEVFLVRAMDYKDLLQEMRIALWQMLEKYNQLPELELLKFINSILSKKLIDEKRHGFKYMKTEDIEIEENNKKKMIKGHINQFVDIDSINEALLPDPNSEKLRAEIVVEAIKSKLTKKEKHLIDKLFLEGRTEYELACQQICCANRKTCDIYTHPNKYINMYSNIDRKSYIRGCRHHKKLNRQSILINRLKKQIIEKIKKNVKKM